MNQDISTLRRLRLLSFREFVAQVYEPEKSAKLNERACERETPDAAQQQLVETLVRAVRRSRRPASS